MADRTSAPETLAQAKTWERVRARYEADGLCYRCACQAAWGHQVGFGCRSPRPWPDADRRIKPPCDECAPIVAGFPVGIPGSPWRRWAQGDRRPARGAERDSDGGSSADPYSFMSGTPATVKSPLVTT